MTMAWDFWQQALPSHHVQTVQSFTGVPQTRLVARGKAKPKVATAIARELTGFIWAIAREVSPVPR